MKKALVIVAGLALAVSAAASAKQKEIDYRDYAVGEPLKEINYYQLYNWQRSTDEAVVLWTKPSQAYVLELYNKCEALNSGRSKIEMGGVADPRNRLKVDDILIVGTMRCKVAGIRALDIEALKRDRKA
jgi:hypothetical protein